MRLAERIHPHFVIGDQLMRVINLVLGHLLNNFLLGNCRVGVAPDRAERVPHIGAGQIDSRADPFLIIPADAGLRAGVTLHRASEIRGACRDVPAD